MGVLTRTRITFPSASGHANMDMRGISAIMATSWTVSSGLIFAASLWMELGLVIEFVGHSPALFTVFDCVVCVDFG